MKMLSIQHLLSVALITIATVNAQDGEKEHQGLQTCGGSLNGPVGLIHTPNCPNAFIVPIKCKWIMENVVNETISIYFTQQYTTSRLTFTEYKYYDDTYKLEERRALTVTEENITRIKWLQELAVNQRPEVWEGSQFILTFMAYGSLDIVFTWYKDGVKVNFNGTTREIWTLTVSEDALGRRMSVPGMLTMLLLASAVAGNAAAMFSLSSNEYHTAQDPYPMALSWVIGACWCAASAAFCTQPLLLDAELTGTTQRRHSVGLLAGVGVLCCLSARLWGGAALQVGSATNNILASGTLFLIMITLTLALCARRSVGYVTHKLALDRRTYIKNRSTIISVLSIVLITFATGIYAKDTRKHQGPQTCGGRLTGPVGLIQTPNFPNAFPVPIKCRWIIENIVNGTISIYFTQQYTTSGLTFTEYTYYDESYKLEERRALTVTDENITRIKWLQVQSPVLVVELTINRLEGTQLRALGLLTVFGFNMTYAVRGPADLPGVSSCSAIECRLLGHCFARHDYRDFYCSCFEDYSGPDCGIGPLCPRSSNMCRNGGTCSDYCIDRQMGPAAVSCICAPGYTGDLCEAQIAQPQCGKEQCSETCKNGTYCDCNPKEADFSSARFDTRLQVVDQPNINISQEIVKQLTSYLIAANITLQDTIEILNISSVEGSGARTVYVRVWSARQDAGPLRTALARLAATRARTHTLRLQPDTLLFEMQPALRLLKLEVNQRSEVWEGSEFILTCMAYGSPDIVFTWYKDGVKINFNGTTREIWTRTSSEDALGRRMSVLGVSAARQVDGGTWSCAADDAGRRRCRALSLTVLSPPTIRLVPSTLTVYKGDNVSITCLAKAGRAHGMLGFSWARERSLLPMQPDRHVWEDLYPAGSVLKLYNIQKSSEYRCQVSSAAGTNSAGMWVWALGADENACQSDVKNGLHWGRTAPGAHATISCPPGYSGEITRHCEPKTGQQGVKWMLPDFSECVADSLKEMYEQFMLISYGYSWGKVSEVLRQYLSVLRLLVIHRGAGATPLYHTTQMLQYLLSDAAQRADRMHSAPHLLNIYDHLLSQPDAFLNEQKIGELQNAVVSAAHMMSKLEARLNSFSVRSESGVHLKTWHAPTTEGAGEWGVMSTHVELAPPVVNLTIVTVLYHDLGARLPSLKKFTEHNGGDEVQYAVCSQQVQVYVSGAPLDRALPHTVTLLYGHSKNYSVDASKLACGLRSMEAPSGWRLSECDVRVSIESRVTCRCRTLGTIALLTRITHTRTESEEELRGIAVICLSVSGAMCVCACALQLLSLAPAAARRRDVMHMLLSASTAAGNAAAMFSLSPCYIAQEPYPVTLGWVVAACWCAASAALCGQPLLLHAELAGTTQRQNSVGLLAGLCVLCCLSARLWGGAPLQVGSAANSIFTAGIVLLSALTLALALCARRTIGHVTHKLPPDRKAYTKNRRRVVNNTLALLLTSLATQLAGVVYAQPGEKQIAHVLSLSVATLANGVGMLVCYVIRDEQCLRAMRSILTLHDNADWHESPAGETSISLYIKQSGEAESHGGVVMLESGTSPVSSGVRYFHAAPLDRRRSNPDSRADIVRCVEYKPSIRGSAQYDTHPHPVCDLIPTSVGSTRRAEYTSEGYMATVCIEPKVLTKPQPALAGLEPYTDKRFDTAKETCTICVQSNPDVSKITFPPVKSCLKNSSRGFTSSTSLPSIDTIKDDGDKSHIEHINIEWNKAYGNPQADKVLNKISNDLDFLLNRMQSISSPHQIEEAPT